MQDLRVEKVIEISDDRITNLPPFQALEDEFWFQEDRHGYEAAVEWLNASGQSDRAKNIVMMRVIQKNLARLHRMELRPEHAHISTKRLA